MAKKQKKPKQGKGKIKAAIMREEHPGTVVPMIATAFLLLALGAGDKYLGLDRVLSIWIGGGVMLAFLAFTPILHNAKYIYPATVKPVLTTMVILMLVTCGGLVFLGSWSRPPVFEKTLHSTSGKSSVTLDSGLYSVMLNGAFKPDEVRTDDKKKVGTRASGNYEVSMTPTGFEGQSKKFEGKFEQYRKKRKLSKKARGYLEIRKTTALNTFYSPKSGEYLVSLDSTSGALTGGSMGVSIYNQSILVYILMLLGLIPIFLGNYVDFIIKRSRIMSLIGPAMGGAIGFAIFFYFESSPIVRFPTMAMDIFIGGLIGVMAAYGLAALMKNLYEKLTFKHHVSL